MPDISCQMICKALAIFILLTSALPAPAITDPLPELTELDYERAEVQTWLPAQDSLTHFLSDRPHQLEARLNWRPGDRALTSRMLLSARGERKAGQPELNGVFYQSVQKGEIPAIRIRLGLQATTRSWLRSFYIGHFRLQAGEGLCLGAYGGGDRQAGRMVYPAPGLSHPALTGVAAQAAFGRLEFTGWISNTLRYATLEDGMVSRLYESDLVDPSTKGRAAERTGGLIAAYRLGRLDFGALCYSQCLDQSAADAASDYPGQAGSLFGSYQFKPLTVSLETLWAGEHPACALRIGHESARLAQAWQLVSGPDGGKLSYARTRRVFGQSAAGRELSWDIRYRLVSKITLTARIAARDGLSGEADSGRKQRTVWSAAWRDSGRESGLTWYRFSRDSAALTDSAGAGLLPVQNRVKVFWAKEISPRISYRAACQYQHYRDLKLAKNGFSLQQTLHYRHGRLEAGLTFQTWADQQSVYQATDIPSDEELLLQADSDTALRLSLACPVKARAGFSLYVYLPFRRAGRRSFRLGLQARL